MKGPCGKPDSFLIPSFWLGSPMDPFEVGVRNPSFDWSEDGMPLQFGGAALDGHKECEGVAGLEAEVRKQDRGFDDVPRGYVRGCRQQPFERAVGGPLDEDCGGLGPLRQQDEAPIHGWREMDRAPDAVAEARSG